MKVHLLMGLGGSGLKTLRRLNRMLTEDSGWRHLMDRKIYYIAVDTAQADLESFRQEIRADAGGGRPPYIASLNLSKGVNFLTNVINDYLVDPFANAPQHPGLERLKEHWWFSPSGLPFRAELAGAISTGASQCPPISFMMAWRLMREFDDVFTGLMDAISERSGPLASNEVEPMVVAGLAGGTGRGCWEILSFRLRQKLKESGAECMPLAFLYDWSCYPNVIEKVSGEQQYTMRVNSVTGASQLSAWIYNFQRAGEFQFSYTLPNLSQPEEPGSDVLQVDVGRDPQGSSPASNAFLFFQRPDLRLSHQENFYEMVAMGLYVIIARSSQNMSSCNDMSASFRSLGSATYEVEATSLRQYFERKAQLRFFSKLLEGDPMDALPYVDAFLEHSRLELVSSGKQGFGEEGTLFERTIDRLMAGAQSGILEPLQKALESDSVTAAEDLTSQLDKVPQKTIADTIKAISAEIAKEKVYGVQPDNTPESIIEGIVVDIIEQTNSLEQVENFLEETASRLRQIYGEKVAFASQAETPRDLVDRYKGYAIGDVIRGGFTRFVDSERVAILGATRAYLEALYTPIVQQGIQELIVEPLIKSLEMRAKHITAFLQLLHRLRSDRVSEIAGEANKLFCSPDDPVSFAGESKRFVTRRLKPPVGHAEQDALLSEVPLSVEMLRFLRQVASNQKTAGREAIEEGARELISDLRNLANSSVQLPEGFIERNFSLLKVVEQLRKAWERKLNRLKGRQAEFQAARQDLMDSFGVSPELVDDYYELPRTQEFVFAMAASIAGTVRPFWQVKRSGKGGDKDGITIYLPGEGDTQLARNRIATLMPGEDRPPEVLYSSAADNLGDPNLPSGAPFRILALRMDSTPDLDVIQSLDYWERDPRVRQVLGLAESPDGDSIFMPRSKGGLGYNDPIYVRNEHIRKTRWKPWVKDDENVEALRLLLYMLLEVPDPYKAALENAGWQLPLLEPANNKYFRFRRFHLVVDAGSIVAKEYGCPWKPEEVLGQSIERVYEMLAGKKEETHTNKPSAEVVSAVRAEKLLFDQAIRAQLGWVDGSDVWKAVMRHNRLRFEQEHVKAQDKEQEQWRQLLELAKGSE